MDMNLPKLEQNFDNDVMVDNYDESYSKALLIGVAKQICNSVDPAKNQRLEGSVMGVTSKHLVLSIGRSALICDLDDLDQIPTQNEKAVIVFAGGKGIVELVRNKEIKCIVSR